MSDVSLAYFDLIDLITKQLILNVFYVSTVESIGILGFSSFLFKNFKWQNIV